MGIGGYAGIGEKGGAAGTKVPRCKSAEEQKEGQVGWWWECVVDAKQYDQLRS